MNLGGKISIERKSKGFSQEALAENSGISLRTIQRIENNSSKPRPYTLKVIAEALNMEISVLVEELNSPSEQKANSNSLSKINLINSSALLGIIIPLFNVIAPLILWKIYKESSIVYEKGRKIISFQILWVLFSVFILLTTHIIHYQITEQFVTGRLSVVVLVYGILLIANIIFIIRASIKLRNGKTEIFPFIPNLF